MKNSFSSHFAFTAIKGELELAALLIVPLPIMGPEKGTDKLAFCNRDKSLLISNYNFVSYEIVFIT